MTVTLNPKITAAGLALFPNVLDPGFRVQLTHVALGTGRYIPSANGSETALRAEVARYAITSGTNPSPRAVQVGLTITDTDIQGRSPNGKGIGEVGFYAGNVLFAVWSQDAEPLFYKSAAFDIPMAYTLDISALPASSVTVTVDANKIGLESFILAHEAKADPHPQYLTPAEGNAAYTPLAHASAGDPHPQYLLQAEGDAAYAPKSHVTDVDPHPQYLTPAEGNAAYTPLAHASAGDPHGQYLLRTDAANGYAPKSHLSDADPHAQYLTAARGNAAYTPIAHAGAANPHPQYMQRGDTDAAYTPVAHQYAGDPHPQYLTAAEGNDAYTARSHTWEGNPHPQYMQRSDTNAAYVKQAGGSGQYGNAVYVGWDGGGLTAQVDSTPLGRFAFQGWVNQVISDVVGAAPSTLDQIAELARALGSDPNFAVTMANSLAGKERKFDAGVRIAFANYSAPVGWTTVNDDSTNNRMLRVVNGNGTGSGGIHDPSVNNVVAAHTHGFTTGTISADHTHNVYDPGHVHGGGNMVGDLVWVGGNSYIEEGQGSPNFPKTWMTTAYTGISLSGVTSNHTHSGSTDNGSSQTSWQPRYLNLIICQKD